ncbi:DMT family transporter [Candidatus Kaiserbacteria bacterium]|nr:DMT family transporter [Candidatus Kaiserbacteria bacterium]
MWLPFALLSGLVFGIRRIYDKKLTGQYDNFSLSFVQQAFSLAPTLLLFLFFPIPSNFLALSWQFWWPLLVIWFILYPVQQYYLFRAIREGDLSHVTPVLALVPVFNAATSFFIIGEHVSILGLSGIFAIVFATFLLLIDTHEDSDSKYNKPVLFMLISCICMAIGSTMDKIAIGASTPVFYSFVNLLGASIIFLVLAYAYGQTGELRQVKHCE